MIYVHARRSSIGVEHHKIKIEAFKLTDFQRWGKVIVILENPPVGEDNHRTDKRSRSVTGCRFLQKVDKNRFRTECKSVRGFEFGDHLNVVPSDSKPRQRNGKAAVRFAGFRYLLCVVCLSVEI